MRQTNIIEITGTNPWGPCFNRTGNHWVDEYEFNSTGRTYCVFYGMLVEKAIIIDEIDKHKIRERQNEPT